MTSGNYAYKMCSVPIGSKETFNEKLKISFQILFCSNMLKYIYWNLASFITNEFPFNYISKRRKRSKAIQIIRSMKRGIERNHSHQSNARHGKMSFVTVQFVYMSVGVTEFFFSHSFRKHFASINDEVYSFRDLEPINHQFGFTVTMI